MLAWLGPQVNRVLRRFGMQLVRAPLAIDSRRGLLMNSRRISAVVDIGANTGQHGEYLRRLGYDGWIYSYEPVPAAFAQLQANARPDPKWKVFPLAVSDQPGLVEMHVAANSVSSSLRQMAKLHEDAAPYSKTVASVSVECTTLDAILAAIPDQPIMVKIDTQGFEDRVFAGGLGMLHKARLLEIEMSLFEVYVGQTLFREMDQRVVAAGYDLVSLADGLFDPRSGELLQVDGIYSRRETNSARITSGAGSPLTR
jgi:FkbM family methyltransferase